MAFLALVLAARFFRLILHLAHVVVAQFPRQQAGTYADTA